MKNASAVLMANGHSNQSILVPRCAAHLAMMARAVFAERGCHDAEQFFWKQLTAAVERFVNDATTTAAGWCILPSFVL